MSANLETMSNEAAAEYLRMAVPLMNRFRIPATPNNYAIWYTYVSGESPELNAEIDALTKNNTPFDAAISADLYQRFVAECEIENIEGVRADLSKLLGDVGSTLDTAGSDANAFEDTLGQLVDKTNSNSDSQGMHDLLSTLIAETRSMRDATNRMQTNFESKNREIEELQQQLQAERQRAVTDPLTGLMNRAGLLREMENATFEFGDKDAPLSIVMLDIDHFKQVNDTHGHLIGDRVIRFVAEVMKKNIKGKDTAARYGGEEFTLLLPDTPLKGAQAVAESIRKTVSQAQLVRADNKAPLGQITLSAGVASYHAEEDLMEFINRADQALYQSKQNGRNKVSAAAT